MPPDTPDYFYSPLQHRAFTNREHELARLDAAVDALRAGTPQHVALVGLRRTGKTWLLKEYIYRLQARGDDVLPIYINLEDACATPELFALRFIGNVAYWLTCQGRESIIPYLDIGQLLRLAPPALQSPVDTLRLHLGRANADRNLLLDLAFSCPDDVARAIGRPLLVMLDEFPAVQRLDNFPGINALATFRRQIEGHRQCCYVICGSVVSAMEGILEQTAPLFSVFGRLSLHPFDERNTRALLAKLLPENAAHLPDLGRAVQRLTGGWPFYVQAVGQRLRYWQVALDLPITVEAVEQAFLVETLSPESQIYQYCRYLYDVSIQQARGEGALRAVLALLAEEDLSTSAVAQRLKVSVSTARDYLRWLAEVDLVAEYAGLYTYNDPVLRYWVATAALGLAIPNTPDSLILKRMLADLQERYRQAAVELGRAMESRVREVMRRFAGQEVAGALLGLAGPVRLPQFETVEPFRSADGQTELDALALGDECWVVEVRWRNIMAMPRDLRQLQKRARKLGARPWFVSRSGFTAGALALAAQEGIMISTGPDLENLERAIFAT
ncbi:MAG: ATP-binding protein [Chloroflexi bacterium]|nr:ATP-binding protein [Chloroflexota bacterium]MBU1748373.1 ATP-binding protein [Chloroflexota bacterium]